MYKSVIELILHFGVSSAEALGAEWAALLDDGRSVAEVAEAMICCRDAWSSFSLPE
jgi:hypothetical protein